MVNEYFAEVKRRCHQYGIDPNVIPSFTKVTEEELSRIQKEYNNILTVIHFFIEKFLAKSEGIPLFVTVTDEVGTFIEYIGDKSLEDTVVNQIGLQKGIQFTERKAGVSSISAAIELEKPIQVIGTEHYHHFLHTAACYSVPFFVNKQLLGTITVMTFLDYAHPMILTSLETVVDSIERELNLREQNRYLDQMNQMMLEQSTIGYIVVDKNGKIAKRNQKAQVILSGFQQACNYIQHIEPFNKLYKRFEQGESIRDYEIVVQNTEKMICLVDYFPFLEGSLIQLHDITEYKKTESYIQNTEKLTIVGQLAAGVAHEIKNPLTTLKGFIQLLQEDRYDIKYTSVMLKEIDRINQITNEFLVLSRPAVLSKDWYDIQTLFSELEVLLTSLAISKNIEFVESYNQIPRIYCDGNQLKQVFINIFKNSVEAIDHNGKIYVSVQPYHFDNILIRIEDNGKGFSDHILNKAGQPFLTTKENGNGLGIMVCKRIIETIHRGQLKLYNNKSGGAVVDVILPYQVE